MFTLLKNVLRAFYLTSLVVFRATCVFFYAILQSDNLKSKQNRSSSYLNRQAKQRPLAKGWDADMFVR